MTSDHPTKTRSSILDDARPLPGPSPVSTADSPSSRSPMTPPGRPSRPAVERGTSNRHRLCVCTRHLGHTWLHAGSRPSRPKPGPARKGDTSSRRPGPIYRCTGHTWPPNRPATRPKMLTQADPNTTDVPDILGPRRSRWPGASEILYITMNRTYLAARPAFSGRSTLAILETYDACVHHDTPDIFGACTHDEPDILFTMYRTYLARALTMYRTYHYR